MVQAHINHVNGGEATTNGYSAAESELRGSSRFRHSDRYAIPIADTTAKRPFAVPVTPALPAMVLADGVAGRVEDIELDSRVIVKNARAADAVTGHPFWLRTNDSSRAIAVPTWVLEILSEANEILVVSQLNYWFRLSGVGHRLRAQVELDGHVWVVKSHAELGNEIQRTARQIQKAVKALTAKRFVVVSQLRSRFHHHRVVSHFRLGWDAIAAAHEIAAEKKQGEAYEVETL